MSYFIQQSFFVIRYRYFLYLTGFIRKRWFAIMGMKVGKGTFLPKMDVTWPHQVSFGENCIIETNIFFKFDGIWKKGPAINIGNEVFIGSYCEFNIRNNIIIGNHTLIASGCRFIDHDHGIAAGKLIGSQPGPEKAIKLGNDVWLGCNVVVLKGVEIGDGALVAAGSVVNQCIPANEIWAGVPAKKIGERKHEQ